MAALVMNAFVGPSGYHVAHAYDDVSALARTIRQHHTNLQETCPITGQPPKMAEESLTTCRQFDELSCCSSTAAQFIGARIEMVYEPYYKRCDACLRNIESLFCALYCSPDQDSFVSAVGPGGAAQPGIKKASAGKAAGKGAESAAELLDGNAKAGSSGKVRFQFHVCLSFCVQLYKSCAETVPVAAAGGGGADPHAANRTIEDLYESGNGRNSTAAVDATTRKAAAEFCRDQIDAGFDNVVVHVFDDSLSAIIPPDHLTAAAAAAAKSSGGSNSTSPSGPEKLVKKKCFGHWYKTSTGYHEKGRQEFDSCNRHHHWYGHGTPNAASFFIFEWGHPGLVLALVSLFVLIVIALLGVLM